MSTEKNLVPITTLEQKITHIPGGVSIYDSAQKNQLLSRPTSIAEVKTTYPSFSLVSGTDLAKQGIAVNMDPFSIQYRYPQPQQTLQSFIGTLPSYTLLFTNPSEDPSKYKFELTTEIYQTTTDITFDTTTPTHFPVKRVIDGSIMEISRLGHMIAMQSPQQEKLPFPPTDLHLYLPPVHIPSQHLGDCAADSIQSLLFFSDKLQQVFAGAADTLYKKYIQTDKSVLFNVGDSRLVEEIRSLFHLSQGNQEEEDILFIFASMLRRFILVRLLDFGTNEEISSLKIPQTTCMVPSAIPPMQPIRGRRKSINVLSGPTLALRITRLFEQSTSFLTSELKLEGPKITLLREHIFYCKLFALFKQTAFHSVVMETRKTYEPPCARNQIVGVSFGVHVGKWDPGAQRHDESGHAFSIFLWDDSWYLQDDNLGIAYAMPGFSFDECMNKKGYFFISSYLQLLKKTGLVEQKYFTQEQLAAGKAKEYGFYGYRYVEGNQVKEKVLLAIPRASYHASFLEGPTRLYLCIGDIDKTKQKGAIFCDTDMSNVMEEVTVPNNKKVKELPVSILSQLDVSYSSVSRQNAKAPTIRNLHKNMQIHLNSFTNTTRKRNANGTIPSNTRKTKNRNATTIEAQLNSF